MLGAVKGHLTIAKQILASNCITLSASESDKYLYYATSFNNYDIALWLLESDFEVVHTKPLSLSQESAQRINCTIDS